MFMLEFWERGTHPIKNWHTTQWKFILRRQKQPRGRFGGRKDFKT